ncbi:MAG: BamA/TamA family outer membrane protein, partial [Acidobacteriota bacterium]
GFRKRYRDTGMFDAHAAWSLKSYKLVDATMKLPDMATGRLQFEMHGNFLDAPSVNFYGLGNDTTSATKVDYSYRTTTVGATATLKPAKVFSVGAGAESLAINAGDLNPAYLKTSAFAEIDYRTAKSYATSGGLYRVDYSNYDERTSGANSFRRVDAEVQQFIPVLRENWVIALRGLASTTEVSEGQSVPFFLTPDLGGKQLLRGYSTWRFRDRNRMLLTGEYRWRAGQFVDMALFLDAGKVEDRLQDLDLTGLKTSYGIGASFHTPGATVMRFEVARTQEGTSLLWSFGPSF